MSTKSLRVVAWALFGAGCIYGFIGALASEGASVLAALVAWIALAAWLERDALARRVKLAYDWAWLMTVFWPVAYVWYGRRTQRSWRTCAGLVALPLLFPIGMMVAAIVKLLFRVFG